MNDAQPPRVRTKQPGSKNLLLGKRVLVTAAAGTGIGFATARRCAEEGATVMMSDLHAERLERCADELASEVGCDVPRVVCDVRSGMDVANLIRRAKEELGAIDTLVNNARLGMTRSLVETTAEHFERILNVNLTGTFRIMRVVPPGMQAMGKGSIIHLSSICAWPAEAGQSAYAASKAGVLALTRCAAIESAEFGVHVNTVVPSLALHPPLEKVSSPEFLQKMIDDNEVLGRTPAPREIANAIIFLASDYASYMTGEALSVSCRRA